MKASDYIVQVECIHAETDCELEREINEACKRLTKYGYEVMNISYAIHSTRVFCLYAMIVYKKYLIFN